MRQYAERPFWRRDGDGAPATSSMVDAICGYVKRFHSLDGDAKAWAKEVYGRRDAMADFLFQVNKLELEGFNTRGETLHALEQLQVEESEEVVAPDERLEQVRCLSRAFNKTWWLEEAEEAEKAPSVNNWKLRRSHELLMESTMPAIAGLFRSGSEVAMTITSSGRQHFYADAWAIRPKLDKLMSKTNADLQRLFEAAAAAMSCKTVEQLLVLATDFFYKFECVHPFVDGNGRCGRMMLAYLLRSVAVFPNVLFATASGGGGAGGEHEFVDRDVYLKCFDSAHEDDNEPQDLTALVIEGVYFGWQRFFAALESWQHSNELKA